MIWFYLHKIAALRPNYNVQYKTREKKHTVWPETKQKVEKNYWKKLHQNITFEKLKVTTKFSPVKSLVQTLVLKTKSRGPGVGRWYKNTRKLRAGVSCNLAHQHRNEEEKLKNWRRQRVPLWHFSPKWPIVDEKWEKTICQKKILC